MGRVILQQRKLREQRERIAAGVHAVPVIDMDAFLGDLDPVARIADLPGKLPDLVQAVGKGFARMRGKQRRIQSLGQAAVFARGIHQAPRPVRLAHRRTGVRADFGREHAGDVEFRDQAEQQGVDAGGVRLGQLGQVADPHHDVDIGITPAQGAVADDGVGKTEVNGIEDAVGDEFPALRRTGVDGAVQRVEVSVRLRDQHRRGRHLFGDPERAFLKAQQVIGIGPAAAQEFVVFKRIDADPVAFLMQGTDRFLQVREGGVRQAAEVDDIRAVVPVLLRP